MSKSAHGKENGPLAIYLPAAQAPDGYFSTPAWICTLLDRPEDSIARMQVTKNNATLYVTMMRYLVQHAVDVTTDELNIDSVEKKGEQLPFLECRGLEIIEDSSDDEDESLFGSPHGYSGFGKPGYPFSLDRRAGQQFRRAPKSKSRFKAVYQLGKGISKLIINGENIITVNSTTGPPVGDSSGATMYSAINFFAREQATIMSMIDAALEWDQSRQPIREGHFKLFSLTVRCGHAKWDMQGYKKGRALSSIILPPGMLDSILEDVEEFTAKGTRKWYISHGLPHRRSYLFYGPPGVGKTSTIRALAGVLQRSTCFLSLGNKDIGNKEMQDAMKTIPKPSILVIEDVDALFNEERKSQNESQLTFSALLNVLDGLLAADGIITILTTNHIKRLDPALIRAGRVDRRFAFKAPTHDQVKLLFLSFYPDADEAIAIKFADEVFARPEKEARSIATLQEHFIFTRKNTAEESAGMLERFFENFYPTMEED